MIRTALVVTLAIALLELGGGLFAGSLALLSDSAHVFMDAFALGIVVLAAAGATRPATARRTFGFGRLETLAALANAAFLFGITVLIVISAIHRFAAPELPKSGTTLAVAVVAFALNLGIGMTLFRKARRNINVRAAFFHVVSDALGALAVVVGGVAMLLTGQAWIDPAISLLISALIVAGVFRIVREAADVLLESAPEHASIGAVRERIRDLSGVVDVHDLHVWTLGSESHALSAHVLLNDARISEASALLRQIDARMRSEFGIGHVTLQFECENCAEDDRIVCTQAAARES